MNIRLATQSDLQDVIMLNNNHNPHPWAEHHFHNLNQQEIWLAEQNHQIIAFAIWQIVLDEAELHLILTHQECRHQQAASLLLTQFINFYQNIKRIILEVRQSNIPAINLYKKHGFIEIAQRKHYYMFPIENAIIMEWKRFDTTISF
ncbi:MAG: ribosomal protein S18-alanine N-acetyltransferase [Neisseriaceae bacterium]|nr:ribosomal protein S18-alanine N-acetyltransferase [Neisseriaceae bacterium]